MRTYVIPGLTTLKKYMNEDFQQEVVEFYTAYNPEKIDEVSLFFLITFNNFLLTRDALSLPCPVLSCPALSCFWCFVLLSISCLALVVLSRCLVSLSCLALVVLSLFCPVFVPVSSQRPSHSDCSCFIFYPCLCLLSCLYPLAFLWSTLFTSCLVFSLCLFLSTLFISCLVFSLCLFLSLCLSLSLSPSKISWTKY